MPLELAGQTYWTLPELRQQFPAKLRPSVATLRRYIRSGKLHATKLGRGTLISAAAIRELLSGSPPEPQAAEFSADATDATRRHNAETRPNFADSLATDCRLRAAKSKRSSRTGSAKRSTHNR